jgi:hypothetical protein
VKERPADTTTKDSNVPTGETQNSRRETEKKSEEVAPGISNGEKLENLNGGLIHLDALQRVKLLRGCNRKNIIIGKESFHNYSPMLVAMGSQLSP